jgi:4a-hydroxytetrahydrobiopterin dehydratase
MSQAPLKPPAIAEALNALPNWTHKGDTLVKRFTFAGFPAAIAFITRIAFDAEALDHHPELRNVYGTVDVRLTTHDAGNRVTELDVELARAIEAAHG